MDVGQKTLLLQYAKKIGEFMSNRAPVESVLKKIYTYIDYWYWQLYKICSCVAVYICSSFFSATAQPILMKLGIYLSRIKRKNSGEKNIEKVVQKKSYSVTAYFMAIHKIYSLYQTKKITLCIRQNKVTLCIRQKKSYSLY